LHIVRYNRFTDLANRTTRHLVAPKENHMKNDQYKSEDREDLILSIFAIAATAALVVTLLSL